LLTPWLFEVRGDFSGAERRYKISGVYARGQDFNDKEPYDLNKKKVTSSFEWVAEGRYNLATTKTDEKLDMINTTTRAAAGSFISTMMCNQDPWLEPFFGPCQFIITTPTGDFPGGFIFDLTTTAAPGNPFSSALNTLERFELNRQYYIFLAARQKLGPVPRATHESTEPSIIAPAHNGYMVYKKGQFIIQPAPNFPGDQILVEFRRLDTAPGKRIPWPLPTLIFSKGAEIPHDIFGTQPGPWAMRARIDAPERGAFSREVRFEYLMQSPFVTPPSKGPVERR
jgi:hypothetical protein